MDGLPLPEELKFINPYLQRAQELKDHQPVISYYCYYYAAKEAIKKGSKTKDCQIYLSKLLDVLEKQKKELADNEAISDDLVGHAQVENFALKVFMNADNEDRAGKASKKTAKTFLAASIFLELLKIFGELDPSIEEKLKYSKWKATDIIKALREGRKPVAGPPGETGTEANPPPETTSPTGSGGGNRMDQDPIAPPSDPHFSAPASAPSSADQAWLPFPSPPVGQPASDFDPSSNKEEVPYQPLFQNPPNSTAPSMPFAPKDAFIDLSQGAYAGGSLPPAQHGNPSAAGPDYNPYFQYQAGPPPPQPPQVPPLTQSHQPSPMAFSPSAPPPPPPPPSAPPQSAQTAPRPLSSSSAPYAPTLPPDMDPGIVAKAQKYSKWAISALNFDDIPAAVDNLQKALALLEPYNR
ncbi:uncharacterized protein VTP21DRAFT_10164 [Calcarisporiella thermophila]|uniref:uncharacterized protein n=1 Tax=Calcarisporiella thermophila TaxID=911321 RepID=UPI003742380F